MFIEPFSRALAVLALVSLPSAGWGQTLTEALASAYSVNPSLNAARSNLRATDENIAIARSGQRPTLAASFSSTTNATRTIFRSRSAQTTGSRNTTVDLTLTQPLFAGFRVRNQIRQAESAVLASRRALENTEQDVLFDTASAFEDVVQDRALVRLRRDNVRFLGEQVRAAQDRFEVGEGTRTDVSQAEARQAQAETALNFAVATLASSEATFFQLTGLEAKTLRDNYDVDRRVPKTLNSAVEIGQQGHPAILASLHDVDTALFNTKVLEGQFLPTVNVVGQVGTTFNPGSGIRRQDAAALGLNVEIPIYQGGRVSAEVRQAKQRLGTSRIQVDVTRDTVRQNTVAAWAAYRASVRSIQTARTGVFAAQLALQGVVEEQRVGQRTTLDVLDAQSDLILNQVTLVQAERDKDVAAFALLSAVGRLTAVRLGLAVDAYKPEEHTKVIRDKWYGLRTPDGR